MLRLALTLSLTSVLLASCTFELKDTADLHRRAGAGDVEAQWMLGWKYHHGEDVTIDAKQAANWYRKAALQGHAKAQWQFGFMLDNGTGVTKNKEEAVSWWLRAAEQGHVIAQNKLGLRYLKGEGGLERDHVAAYAWYSVAANEQELSALANLMNAQERAEGQELSRKLHEQIEANAEQLEAQTKGDL